ncbi:MAG: cellulase family glycosylhydrolase [Alphaproteobacteria bacterium]|nr:cellulase family glycosylhydrolase [Alphaproteobacteria bacterium]
MLPRLATAGEHFIEPSGRRVILRGVNLGGDCKVPYPDGGTNHRTNFSDHRKVSFIGRPFPLAEADEHLGRLKAWGFNCVRLLTTWEAIEHAGPGEYDEAYLDYFAEVTRRAGDHGLYVFVDFHQDVWSRMTGGDGAPGWLFESVGLDFTKFHTSGAAHVMQYKYDYARGGRQEDRYPMMTWSTNYRMPANAIMWTLFFAGNLYTPSFKIDGRNVQDFLQGHYLGCMREIAQRVKDMPHVLGFDTLNEPSTGWIGKEMSYRHLERNAQHPEPARPGPAWSPFDGLLVARGVTRKIPELAFDPSQMKVAVRGENEVNAKRISIWRDGRTCPFAEAGAYRLSGTGGTVLREDFFQVVGGKKIDSERDAMLPFYRRVAELTRGINPDWLVFTESDPFRAFTGEGMPKGMPERMVNASHWYDIVTLATKTFMYPTAINPFNGRTLNGAGEIEESYTKQLGRIKAASATVSGGAPTLLGEFGIPYDLDGGAAYAAWDRADHSSAPWEKHVIALDLMYNALDAHLMSSTQWNYTASNRNDAATGDGWNQEDLSAFSRDQQADPKDINSGGRALAGFVRPYVRATQGMPKQMRFDRERGEFTFVYDADPAIKGPTEIFVPKLQFPDGFSVTTNGDVQLDAENQLVTVAASAAGEQTITIARKPAAAATSKTE